MMACTSRKRATDLWVRSLRRDWLRSCPHRLLGAVKASRARKRKENKGEQDRTKRRESHKEARVHRNSCVVGEWRRRNRGILM